MTDRTTQIVRAIWDLTHAGQYTVKAYRVSDQIGPLTPLDVEEVLDTGLVAQIPGMGGPSSFRMTVTLDDLMQFEEGLFYDKDVETLGGLL